MSPMVSNYVEQALHKQIDSLLERKFSGSVQEWTLPPYVAAKYLEDVWGFGTPSFYSMCIKDKTLTFQIRSAISLTIYLEVSWESGFRRGFRIIKKEFTM